jgi:hypothetical protein
MDAGQVLASKCVGFLAVSFVILVATRPVSAHDEIDVGVTAAGKLTFGGHLHIPFRVPQSLYPTLTGYTFGDLVITARTIPTEPQLLPVSPAAFLALILDSANPQLAMYDADVTARVPVGQSLALGYAPFSTTPVFNFPPGTALGTTMSAQFRLHDTLGNHTDSDPFTLTFTAVPEPAWGLMGLAAVALLLTRRGRFVVARA